jgi:hypothetical protein
MRREANSSRVGFSVNGPSNMPEGKVLARLGDVLYWIGCVFAAIVVVWGVVFCFRGDRADDPYLLSLVAVAAFAIWVIGRACRYILSGK